MMAMFSSCNSISGLGNKLSFECISNISASCQISQLLERTDSLSTDSKSSALCLAPVQYAVKQMLDLFYRSFYLNSGTVGCHGYVNKRILCSKVKHRGSKSLSQKQIAEKGIINKMWLLSYYHSIPAN